MDSLPLIAIVMAATGCIGIKQYTQFSYSQQKSASAISKEKDKRGAELTYGIGTEMGDHRMRLGFHYQDLPDTSSTRQVTIDPDDYREGPPKDKYLFDEEFIATTTGRVSMDFSASLERRMFRINPVYEGNDIEWLQFSGLLGAGINFNLETGNTENMLGENKIIDTPEAKLASVLGFGSASFELKLGKHPYPIIPLQFDLRVYHSGEVSNLFRVGYEVQWSEGDKR